MVQKMKSRKGFTLIEMLVVIAIIAVLVAIIIPVVSNSTAKAEAAADAANARAVKAEVVTQILTGEIESNQAAVEAYVESNFGDIEDLKVTLLDDGDVEVEIDGKSIAELAEAAGGKSTGTTNPTPEVSPK